MLTHIWDPSWNRNTVSGPGRPEENVLCDQPSRRTRPAEPSVAFRGVPQAIWGRGLPQILSKASMELLPVICSEAARTVLHRLPGKTGPALTVSTCPHVLWQGRLSLVIWWLRSMHSEAERCFHLCFRVLHLHPSIAQFKLSC